MSPITSRYKILGGFGLMLLLCLGLMTGTLLFITSSEMRFDKVNLLTNRDVQMAYITALGLNLLIISVFASQCKYIIADEAGITFINPVLPFRRKSYRWSDFDYFITVDEESKLGAYEAVWLMQDEKIRGRFSSFYYTNYADLKAKVRTPDQGKKYIPSLVQGLAILRLIRIKKQE